MSVRPGSVSAGSVVVVGAINVDLVVAAERLPGPGETVVGPRLERHGGGKGANAAVAAARAGAAASLIGAVGGDEMAPVAAHDLRQAGVDLTGVASLAAEPTGVALIVVDRAGENQIAVGAGANLALDKAWVEARMAEALPGAGCVLVSTELPGEAVAAAVIAAATGGVTCVLNPAPPIAMVGKLLKYGPLLTPNAHELAALHSLLEDDGVGARRPANAPASHAASTAAAQASALALRTGAPVVVTLGGDGALVALPGGSVKRIAGPPAQVVDTTGAGDTFNGVLAAWLAAGAELTEAVRVAVIAATLSVAEPGARTGMPSAEAITAALASSIEPVDGEQLRVLQAPLKERYRAEPEAALITLSAVGSLEAGIACSVQTGRAIAEAGLHPASGGDGSLLCSGDMLLESLVACAGVTLRAVATSLGIDVASGTVRAEGDLDFRGTLGVDREAPVGFRAIRLSFELESDADAEALATLQRLTERYCVVYQTLAGGATLSTSLAAV